MKEVLKISKAELANKIGMIKKIVPSRTPQVVLQSILVEGGYLIANNLETAAMVKLEGMETEPFLIPSAAFEIIGKYPSEELTISVDKGVIQIKAGSIKNKFATQDPSEYPRPVDQNAEGERTSIPFDDFRRSVQRVQFAMGSGDRMECLNLKAHAGTLYYIALDGKRIAKDQTDFIGEFELLIPKRAIEQILSMDLDGEMEIVFNQHSAVFQTEGFTITTRLLDGKGYDTDRMLSVETPLHTAIDRERLLGSITRVKMCETAGENVPVRMNFDNGTLAIDLQSRRSSYHEELPLEINIEQPIETAFDYKLLIDYLKVLDKDIIRLGLTNAKSPMYITQENDEYKGLVLPVRVKEV